MICIQSNIPTPAHAPYMLSGFAASSKAIQGNGEKKRNFKASRSTGPEACHLSQRKSTGVQRRVPSCRFRVNLRLPGDTDGVHVDGPPPARWSWLITTSCSRSTELRLGFLHLARTGFTLAKASKIQFNEEALQLIVSCILINVFSTLPGFIMHSFEQINFCIVLAFALMNLYLHLMTDGY